jgi:hypothetical protein
MVRDQSGKFVKGHPPIGRKGGRPPRAVEEVNLFTFRAGVTTEQIEAVRDALYGRALDGEVSAAKLWLAYSIGEVPQQMDLSILTPDAFLQQLEMWEVERENQSGGASATDPTESSG